MADRQASGEITPCVQICNLNGSETGLALPGGSKSRGGSISSRYENTGFAVLPMCPDLVIAAQRLAAESSQIKAEVYDIHHFEQLKIRWNVMSVPCLVINDAKVSFGKKNIRQIWDIIREV